MLGGIAVGVGAGQANQLGTAVAMGSGAGQTNQGSFAVAIGGGAGGTGQGTSAVAIGQQAGQVGQGNSSVAIGQFAGLGAQSQNAVAIGTQAGQSNQGSAAVAVGLLAGSTGQGNFAVAIGQFAGRSNQGAAAIALGYLAAPTNQGANSIVINATGVVINSPAISSCSIAPIRTAVAAGNQLLMYNGTEVVASSAGTSATNKTFVIPHPMDSTRYLVHACLEGPEAGVYYRGSAVTNGEGRATVQLPVYTAAFTDFTVHLTPQSSMTQFCSSPVGPDSYFHIETKVPGVHMNWLVHALRAPVNAEPLVSEVTVLGAPDTPYRWIAP